MTLNPLNSRDRSRLSNLSRTHAGNILGCRYKGSAAPGLAKVGYGIPSGITRAMVVGTQ